MNWAQVGSGVLAGLVLGTGSMLLTIRERTARLEVQLQEVRNQLESLSHARSPEPHAKASDEPAEVTGIVEIPPAAGWKPQGDVDRQMPGGYRDGIVELRANLDGGDSYAELFLDLRPVRLVGLPRNPDGSYNLAGVELVAHVTADRDFTGDSNYPNGVQFIVKNAHWANDVGPWLNVTDAMKTPEGMEVSYPLPDNMITRNAAALSLKVTIGSGSAYRHAGRFVVTDVGIVPRGSGPRPR